MKTDTLIIGSLKFTEQSPPKYRGGPRCVLSTNAKGRADLRFNASQLESMPGFSSIDRLAVFLAAGDKPVMLLVVSEDGTKLRGEASGACKITGSPLRVLAAKYKRIMFSVAVVESPRKGWLLTSTESERR